MYCATGERRAARQSTTVVPNAGAMGEELPFPNTTKEHYRMEVLFVSQRV
jgi:hypothetical protein